MNLKEAMTIDAESVFLNPSEFGEAVTINGADVIAVRGEEYAFDAAAGADFGPPSSQPELPRRVTVLHVKTADLPPEAGQGASVRFDGEQHIVVSRHDGLGGMSRLEITRRGYRYA